MDKMDGEEIKITPEMARAGIARLRSGMYETDESIVREVFSAMIRAGESDPIIFQGPFWAARMVTPNLRNKLQRGIGVESNDGNRQIATKPGS